MSCQVKLSYLLTHQPLLLVGTMMMMIMKMMTVLIVVMAAVVMVLQGLYRPWIPLNHILAKNI